MKPALSIAKNVLIGFDQTINCVVWIKGDGFGYPDETLSARAWRLRGQSNSWKRIDALLFFDKDHCRTSYEHSMSHLFDAPEYRP